MAMCCLAFAVRFLLFGLNSSTKMCTKDSNFPFLHHGVKLPGKDIVNVTAEGLVTCARTCLTSDMCKSFNFDTNIGQCELNYATLTPEGLNVTHLIAAADFVFTDITHWPQKLGACANHQCGFFNAYCQPLDANEYVCSQYVVPTSCAEIKECDPSSTDGEYWIRLPNFDLYKTRIYCHNMTTDNPLEYLTLPTPNHGVFPNVSNKHCQRETPLEGTCVGNSGETFYSKIRVVIQTMEILRNDSTYAFFTNRKADYATVTDCYSIHYNGVISSCGTRGTFTINLTDTGWVVSSNQRWQITTGWMAIVESVTFDDFGSVVHIKCGGFVGRCEPDGPMLLKPYPEGDVTESSAKEVTCFL
ncbi:A disintegrin and metalloproteinase with thrombospondin motifs 9-like isoform X1 [Haliotis rubra]|uniref:A disintegrin and metalloproteinase with thrombospondin motifs 9-like isoform X1 n=1 Tax=Haliotis rubra TaxID=36100 RepID=UPI001EE62483|nr:A disintegrin and metalloproteinase with thrombospondin motifs 9-like isoform X1 [Haliotis rubra]